MNSDVGKDFYIVQDYTTGTSVIDSQPFTASDAVPGSDFEVLQADYESRARKDRRIQLHLVLFPGQRSRIGVFRLMGERRAHMACELELGPLASTEDEAARQSLESFKQMTILTAL